MHRMLQQPAPDDYVIATGETHTVREFCQQAFAEVGLDYRDYVQVNPKLFRPAEVHVLVGDAAKARTRLGWQPRKTFTDLVRAMVAADLEAVQLERAVSRHTTPLPARHGVPAVSIGIRPVATLS